MGKGKLKKAKKGSKKVRAEKARIARAALDLREAYATLFVARVTGVLEEREPSPELVAEADAALDARTLTCTQVWDLINRFVGNEPGTWGIVATEAELVPELENPEKAKKGKKAAKPDKDKKAKGEKKEKKTANKSAKAKPAKPAKAKKSKKSKKTAK